MNPATSNPLEIRLVLFGPDSTGHRWTSADSLSIANDGQWNRHFFPINEQAVTPVLGSSAYEDLIGGTVRLMLRHDPGTPSAGGAAIQAQLGIDNIALVPEPLTIASAIWAIPCI
jgi:hypothetical protein